MVNDKLYWSGHIKNVTNENSTTVGSFISVLKAATVKKQTPHVIRGSRGLSYQKKIHTLHNKCIKIFWIPFTVFKDRSACYKIGLNNPLTQVIKTFNNLLVIIGELPQYSAFIRKLKIHMEIEAHF